MRQAEFICNLPLPIPEESQGLDDLGGIIDGGTGSKIYATPGADWKRTGENLIGPPMGDNHPPALGSVVQRPKSVPRLVRDANYAIHPNTRLPLSVVSVGCTGLP